ncbi:MAG: hypothetical protein AAFO69_03900 [Bacteroidota bacterium]
MSDLEYDVLDELYFVQSYSGLLESIGFEEDLLNKVLKKLLAKKWIKCLRSQTEEITYEELDFEKDFRSIFYLATKSGLLAHNSH